MTNRGRIRLTCLECKTAWLPKRAEWDRAKIPQCPGCGSRFWLESKMSRDEHKLAVHRGAGTASEHSKRVSGQEKQ